MTSQHSNEAELALRLIVAKYFDMSAALSAREEIAEASAALHFPIESARRVVVDCETASELLSNAADILAALPFAKNAPLVLEAIDDLRSRAKNFKDNLWSAQKAAPSDQACDFPCGVADLLKPIEDNVRGSYISAANSVIVQIVYLVRLASDNISSFLDGQVGGQTNICCDPREIKVDILRSELTAASICRLVYVVFHELTCHGFQTSTQPLVGITNAPATCHWTEGWMDSVALEMALGWATVPKNALGWLLGEVDRTAESILKCHWQRYEAGKLNEAAVVLRRASRAAYGRLRDGFRACGLASDDLEGRILAQRFSLAANSAGDHTRLRNLSTNLQVLLLPVNGHHRQEIINACYAFTIDKDFNTLENFLTKEAGTLQAMP